MKFKYLSLILLFSALIGQEAFGSKALEERGASCTDYCTKEGKSIPNLPALGESMHPVLKRWSVEKLSNVASNFSNVCKRLSSEEMKGPRFAGNPNWCEENCLKGGVVSFLKGRKSKVEAFVKERKEQCKALAMGLEAQYPHTFDTNGYKNKGDLVIKPSAPSDAPPAPPAPSDMPPALPK